MSAGFAAVVTDLDGTVIRRDGSVSAATLRAAAELRARNIPLIAATARTPYGVQALTGIVPALTFAVCCSGAVGYDPAGGDLAWRDPLPRDVVSGLLAHLRRRVPAAGVGVFDGRQWRLTAKYFAIRPAEHKGPVSVVDERAILAADACSMVVGHPEWDATRLAAALAGAPVRATLARAGPRFVEVTAAAVDKASGVLRALRTQGVPPERAVAFGDMPVDMAMFAVVGHSVAMADAPGEVLASAAARTGSVEDDGFARMLVRLGVVPPGVIG